MRCRMVIGSPVDYDQLVVYIVANGTEIALVQKEEGATKVKIEFFEESVNSNVYLDDFIEVLNHAKKELLK
ncbi:MAG: hypothetical protein V4649_14575 [Bacteroidota bacterium]